MKRIKSSDLPQADRLESVLMAVMAVGNGAHTDIEIANRIPGIEEDDRQGRYYRNAAEMLGFIANLRNYASLTEKGLLLLEDPTLNNPVFVSAVLNLEVYQKLLPFLEIHPQGLTRHEIQNYLESFGDPGIGPTMIPRRISTIFAWLKALGFLTQGEDGRYHFENNLAGEAPVFEILDDEQPLFPRRSDLLEFQEIGERLGRAGETVAYLKDAARLERSVNAHTALVNLVARRIREQGGVPKSNRLVDLAVRFGRNYLFEMKSTNEYNFRSQVRKAMSQLYEYRYLQNIPEASLVLVIESPPEPGQAWMLDFLENDRGILVVWDGDGRLYGSGKAREMLGFLGLNGSEFNFVR